MRDAALTIFLAHVFENFAAAGLTKIDIDVRWRDAVRIQKALEDQSVLQRVDVGDSENVSDNRTRGRTAPGPNRNAFLFGKMNEIPNNEEITDEPSPLENAELIIKSLDQLCITGRAFAVSLAQAFVTKLAQIAFARFPSRRRILRVLGTPKFEIDMATFADFQRVCNGFRKIAKHLAHFGR